VPVDPRGLDALGDAPAREHEVDAHPEVLVEHPGPVVPVGEHPLVGPAVAHDVAQAEVLERGERRSLGAVTWVWPT
jgi:hypothetical protein